MIRRRFAGWTLFFLISFGLGYPTLNRYDPRQTGGLLDTATYYEVAVHGTAHADAQLRDRVLTPWFAGRTADLVRGHTGTWEPVFFGFLVVNSCFTAGTALLITETAGLLAGFDGLAGMLAALLYLLNFETSNILLSGMTDAADGFFLMLIVWSLLCRKTRLLPLWGIAGALAKETFVPLSLVFTAVWWLVSRPSSRWRTAESAAILSTGLFAAAANTAVQSSIGGHLVLPWEFAGQLGVADGRLAALVNNTFDRNILFMAVWLVPLGLPGIRRMPLAWVAASIAAVVAALGLVVWHASSAGAAARPMFTLAGPLLSLAMTHTVRTLTASREA